MKTKLIIITLMFILMIISIPAFAQMHGGKNKEMPMDASMMHRHMHEMAELMHSMAETMHRGDMTPEQQAECAGFMDRLGDMMNDASRNNSPQAEQKRTDELDELKEEWDYWRDEHEDH